MELSDELPLEVEMSTFVAAVLIIFAVLAIPFICLEYLSRMIDELSEVLKKEKK